MFVEGDDEEYPDNAAAEDNVDDNAAGQVPSNPEVIKADVDDDDVLSILNSDDKSAWRRYIEKRHSA